MVHFLPSSLLLVVMFAATLSAQDTPLAQLLIDREDWELVAEGFQFTEGPACDAQGNVYFTDVPNSRIHKIDVAGKVSVFAEETQQANGLMFGPNGKLYACQNGAKRIVTYDANGKPTTLAEGVSSNDLVVNRRGDVYFTDPGGGQVWYLPAGGKPQVVAKNLRPNGLILWPRQGTLVVTDSRDPVLWAFRIHTDGKLGDKERYYLPLQTPSGQGRAGSDGMTVDRSGRLYVATYQGVQVLDPTGRVSVVLAKPQRRFLSNVTFGGPDLNYLYATCSDKVFRRKMKVQGISNFEQP